MSQIKLADLLTPHLESLKSVELLIEGFELRLQAEDQYERALVRIAQKFNPPNASKSDCYGLLLGELSRIHSERSYQVNYFCEQVKADVQQLRSAAKGISTELDNRLKQFRKIEKDFRLNTEKLDKGRAKTVQSHRQLDERILLNEIGKLNREVNEEGRKKLMETTTRLMAEQKEIIANYSSTIDTFRGSIQAYNESLPKIVSEVKDVASRMRGQFFDVMKKYTIHEVSLLRNIQYDVDKAILRIEKEQNEPMKEIMTEPLPDYVQVKEEDTWDEVRLQILFGKGQKKLEREQPNEIFLEQFKKAVSAEEEHLTELLRRLNQHYSEIRDDLQKCIESYRLSNKFKFEQLQYRRLVAIFRQATALAYKFKDMDSMQRVLLFSITYYRMEGTAKRYLFEDIRDFKFFCGLEFWRFYCYFALKAVLVNYRSRNAVENQAENMLHEKNSVYSTLLTCANNMVQFGIEKQTIKNFVAKAAKSFPLNEAQITEILKFVENQHNNFDQIKKRTETEVPKPDQRPSEPGKILKFGKGG